MDSEKKLSGLVSREAVVEKVVRRESNHLELGENWMPGTTEPEAECLFLAGASQP